MFDIIFFAALAVFMGVKLYKALGNKDYEATVASDNNVVQFPDGNREDVVDIKFEQETDNYDEIEKKYGPEIAAKIKRINEIDPSFTEKNFLQGAKRAFEMILESFASGDKSTLKRLLSKDIYRGFTAEIDKRNKNDNIEENTLVSILASNIKSVILERKYAKIAVEIVSEQINIVKDKTGKVIEGDPTRVNKVSELWTFARNLNSSNPNWELVETGHSK